MTDPRSILPFLPSTEACSFLNTISTRVLFTHSILAIAMAEVETKNGVSGEAGDKRKVDEKA